MRIKKRGHVAPPCCPTVPFLFCVDDFVLYFLLDSAKTTDNFPLSKFKDKILPYDCNQLSIKLSLLNL